jgi:hypothetical protein
LAKISFSHVCSLVSKFIAISVVLLFVSVAPGHAQDFPLVTPEADTVPMGHLLGQIGYDFLHNECFPLSGLCGDLSDVGVVNLRTGVGSIVEIQIQGIAQEFLSISQRNGSFVPLSLDVTNTTHDVGDFSFWTKVRFFGEKGKRPALALRFGYLMPNSDQAQGIGTNSENVYGEFILQKHFQKLKVWGNIGLAILTSPNTVYSQNDELLYGLAMSYPIKPRFRVMAEVNGRYNDRVIVTELEGTQSYGQGRFGMQYDAGGLTWSAAAITGVNAQNARIGFFVGVSRDFKIFGGKN